jgi:YHS domain-containing protein
MRALVVAVTLMSLTACDAGKPAATASAAPTSAPTSSTTAAPADGLVRVADSSLVCMVNDQFMGRPQIPVPVEGRIYYGCCENCKAKLASDTTARTGTDPVTGQPVDKSTAVIGQEPSGKVLYFASEANFTKYAASPRPL